MIEQLEIKLDRYIYGNDEQELTIRIKINGKEYHNRSILTIDDFTTYFERIFEIAKHEFLIHLKRDY